MTEPTQLLAVDCGNTHIKFGVFRGDALAANFRIATDAHKTSDEYAVLIRSLLAGEGIDGLAFAGSAVSSVVPPVLPLLERAVAKVTARPCLVIRHGLNAGIAVRTNNPGELGSDLLCLAAGAAARYPLPAVIVSFGTATAFVAVSAEREIVGVAIAPGILSAAQSLSRNAAKLPQIDLARPESPLGRDTIGAMRAGMVYGFAGLVDRVCQEMGRAMGAVPTVVATGGLLNIIAQVATTVTRYDAFLSLHGLRIIWELNGGGAAAAPAAADPPLE
jgi:type III pantothenate kinase